VCVADIERNVGCEGEVRDCVGSCWVGAGREGRYFALLDGEAQIVEWIFDFGLRCHGG
jgi:hypothetical protein